MDYIMETELFWYNENKRRQQTSMESYLRECMILAESSNVIGKLRAINEEEKKSGWERIKEGFKKFGEFIKRIFAKFIDRLTRFFQNNKAWLDKHRAVILNNPFKFEGVTMYNYADGVKRMVGAAVPNFEYDAIQSNLTSDQTAYEWMAKSIGYQDYKYADSDDSSFNKDIQNWFRGGEDQIFIEAKKLNMSDIFNYCYEYNKMEEQVKKDQGIVDKATESAKTLIDKRISNMTADKAAASAETSEKEPKPDLTGTGESAVAFSNVYGTYITEDIKVADPVEDKKDDTTTPNKASSATGKVGEKDATAASNMKNRQDSDKTAEEIKDANTKSVTDADNSVIEEMGKKCTRYQAAASGVLSAKVTVIEQCYKDYMKLLVAHVESYIGKKQNNNKVTQAATDYRNLNEYKKLSEAEAKEFQDEMNRLIAEESYRKAVVTGDAAQIKAALQPLFEANKANLSANAAAAVQAWINNFK